MAKDILLAGFYAASSGGTGVPGLTVTIDIWRVAIADLAKSQIVEGGSCTEIGDGVYAYRVANADLQTYYYYGICKTADTTVAQKHVASVNLDFADSPGLVALIWNAGARTLTGFGTLVADIWANATRTITGGGGSSAADVWSYAARTLTQNAEQVIEAVQGSTINIRRGDTVTIAITGLGSLAGRSKLWFTVKDDITATDALSIIQIEETAGLLYLNKLAGTASDGSLVVDDEAAGNITITLKPEMTAVLTARTKMRYDVQVRIGTDTLTLAEGKANVIEDVTRTLS